jgi:carboxyl-terminal processing protease
VISNLFRAGSVRARQALITATTTLVVSALLGCGGGGSSGGGGGTTPGTGNGAWQSGVFAPSGNFDALCVNPRSGNDPMTGRPYPDRAGTRTDQNNWLRSWSNELYLWYDEIVDRNPANYPTPQYFELLKTTAVTSSGRDKDNFHFSLATDEWVDYAVSGIAAGYGVFWVLPVTTPPREILVGFAEPGSPATSAPVGLLRGTRILEVDGIDAVWDNTQDGVDVLNAGIFPADAGETHVFRVQDPVTLAERNVTMTSALVTTDPVPVVHTVDALAGKVGYLLFNDHIATAESALVAAVEQLQAADIDELVLDIRYNGGGYLDIASELAYMIAGPTRTAGRTFELLQFNDKHTVNNPVTGQPLAPTPFHDETQGFSQAPGTALPTLDLGRVYLLTGPDTCSASESILNGLRGIGVDVVQIGGTTCGKPYGFYPADNCGTTYFTVQFQGVNDAGFGAYPDGFSPANSSDLTGVPVSGCAVRDDLSHALGDPAEERFAAALRRMHLGTCPAPSSLAPPTLAARSAAAATTTADAAAVVAPGWRQSRVMRPDNP